MRYPSNYDDDDGRSNNSVHTGIIVTIQSVLRLIQFVFIFTVEEVADETRVIRKTENKRRESIRCLFMI